MLRRLGAVVAKFAMLRVQLLATSQWQAHLQSLKEFLYFLIGGFRDLIVLDLIIIERIGDYILYLANRRPYIHVEQGSNFAQQGSGLTGRW